MTCPESFSYIFGGCYQLSLASYTWFDAASYCQNQGASLVTVTSLAQNRWVYEYYRTLGQTGNSIWLGGTDISKEGTFQWIDGSDTSHFHYWAANQPDNNGGAENCLCWWAGYNGQWNDNSCGNAYKALCKWTNTTVVTPQGM